MASNRRYKSPTLHRLTPQQQDQTYQKTNNIYTKEFYKEKSSKEENPKSSRGFIGKSKYKKTSQKSASSQQTDRINTLTKQNSQLRKEIVELKVHQFYQFDDKKLKQLLIEVETLKKQLKKCQDQLDETLMENDYLRRSNIELKHQLEKYQQDTQLYERKYRESAKNNVCLSPRMYRDDQQLTERYTQRPMISSSSPKNVDNFQDCRLLLQHKTTNKKQKSRRVNKDYDQQHMLRLESKQKIQPVGSRNSTKPMLSPSTSSREAKELLLYKSKRNHMRTND